MKQNIDGSNMWTSCRKHVEWTSCTVWLNIVSAKQACSYVCYCIKVWFAVTAVKDTMLCMDGLMVLSWLLGTVTESMQNSLHMSEDQQTINECH